MEKYFWAALAVVLHYGLTSWLRHRRYGGRPCLPVSELLAPLVSRSGLPADDVRAAWCMVAEQLRIDPSQLRPDDELTRLAIMPTWLVPWDHGCWTRTASLVDSLRSRLRESEAVLDLAEVRTLGDFVLTWCRVEAQRRREEGVRDDSVSTPLWR